jgi:hypothetical protein
LLQRLDPRQPLLTEVARLKSLPSVLSLRFRVQLFAERTQRLGAGAGAGHAGVIVEVHRRDPRAVLPFVGKHLAAGAELAGDRERERVTQANRMPPAIDRTRVTGTRL